MPRDCFRQKARHNLRATIQVQSRRETNQMLTSSAFVSQASAGKNPGWGIVFSLVLAQIAWSGTSQSAPSQTIILRPAPAPPLRIGFDYNFQKALPPFPKEPALPGKEIARGLIPTVPPTPLLRVITDNELRLNTDHTGDFVAGKTATYRSFYNGHVVFTNLTVTTIRDGLEIPYTLDLFSYEHGCAGWLDVRSGWKGQITVADQPWRVVLVQARRDGRCRRGRLLGDQYSLWYAQRSCSGLQLCSPQQFVGHRGLGRRCHHQLNPCREVSDYRVRPG
jgi:hypothetical protein